MVKVKFIGDNKQKFNWVSMGKAKSYLAHPGRVLNIPKTDLPYLMSFGKFEIISTDSETSQDKNKSVIKEIKIFESKKRESIIESPKIEEKVEKIIEIKEESKIEERKVEEPVIVNPPVENTEVKTEEVKVEDPVLNNIVKTQPAVFKAEEPKEDSKIQKHHVDYTKLKKKELQKICKDNKLDISGNRDDLIARCVDLEKSKEESN